MFDSFFWSELECLGHSLIYEQLKSLFSIDVEARSKKVLFLLQEFDVLFLD